MDGKCGLLWVSCFASGPPESPRWEDIADKTTNSTIHFVFVNFEKLASLCANPSYLQNTDNLQFSISAFVLLTRWMRHSSLRPVRCVWQVDLSRWSSVGIPLFSSPRSPAKIPFCWGIRLIAALHLLMLGSTSSQFLLLITGHRRGGGGDGGGADNRLYDLTHHVLVIGNRRVDVCIVCTAGAWAERSFITRLIQITPLSRLSHILYFWAQTVCLLALFCYY